MSNQSDPQHQLKLQFTALSAQLGDHEFQYKVRREQLLAQMTTVMQQFTTLQAAAEVQKKASEASKSEPAK